MLPTFLWSLPVSHQGCLFLFKVCALFIGHKTAIVLQPCLGCGAQVIKAEPVEQVCHLGSFGYKEQTLNQVSQVTVCGCI